MTRSTNQRNAFSLIELLVVIGILSLTMGLLLPAIQKVRENASAIYCANNSKQLVLACHDAHDTYGKLPAGIGYYPGSDSGAWGTGMFHLLPFLEENGLYNKGENPPYVFGAWNNGIYAQPVTSFICGSDPSIGNGAVADNQGKVWGASSYAGNTQVFAKTEPNGSLIWPQGETTLITIRDGLSNTIMFGEHYARCTNAEWPEGGSLWAYWHTRPSWPLHPAFAVSWTGDSIGPGSKFQHVPAMHNCNPTLASTGHTGGMITGMCDGSVRTLPHSINGAIWWAMCTPRNGD